MKENFMFLSNIDKADAGLLMEAARQVGLIDMVELRYNATDMDDTPLTNSVAVYGTSWDVSDKVFEKFRELKQRRDWPALGAEMRAQLDRGDKIGFIKNFRFIANTGLKDSKDFADAFGATYLPEVDRDTASKVKSYLELKEKAEQLCRLASGTQFYAHVFNACQLELEEARDELLPLME